MKCRAKSSGISKSGNSVVRFKINSQVIPVINKGQVLLILTLLYKSRYILVLEHKL